ncbi:hypothetical protein HMPREF0946_01060 [Fusobacterium vincentii 3_1_36A2]|uniref:Carbohydrate kinase PfkB domain-containing protein n=1 Tax=Fusobacterium vincentii 3_1_36A2 TaxID=469604 RepID=C7XQ94_FUSVC|nr:hypothetical protein HMPREF0946_01060 [Fusobacterium vincentii 3_1_36A2]
MIYSVTLNPSIDFIVRVKDFQLGETNRAYEDNFFAGGKGIMVSKLLKNVKTDCVNLGFLGGFTGAFIEQNLKKLNILSDFVTVNENTRVNVKLKTETETEINCQGPKISDSEKEEFLDKITNHHFKWWFALCLKGTITSLRLKPYNLVCLLRIAPFSY